LKIFTARLNYAVFVRKMPSIADFNIPIWKSFMTATMLETDRPLKQKRVVSHFELRFDFFHQLPNYFKIELIIEKVHGPVSALF
jgi:hypothetical protein